MSSGARRHCRPAALLCLSALAAGWVGVGVGCAAPTNLLDADALSRVRRIAVLDFSGSAATEGARPGGAVAGAVLEEFRQSLPGIEIIERSELDKALTESKLSSLGLTAESSAKELGAKLGVQAVVLGDTLQYTHDLFGKSEIYDVGAAMRIVDVATGQVIYSSTGHSRRYDSFGPATRDVARQLLSPLRTGLSQRGRA
jgi:hypothetical protein